ncbi:MAG: hypothetical protein WBL06_09855 [Pseudolysinimonas sp.]|uniref:hypothetical protein n=1 Tax=Pseudolysinimonas sp. TaxID=2680009 RepID=UPI003C75D8AD
MNNAPVEYPLAAPTSIDPVPASRPRPRRRPIFGGIAFALVVLAYLAAAGIAFYAYGQTVDAFIQGPPWWALTSQLAVLPVGILCFLGLVLGIIGTVRREKPGWPAITAMIFSLPGFGYVAAATYVWFTVTAACASPPGACGF